jgi:hypothetical protein
MQLHERFEPGCEAAFQAFLEGVCADGTRFKAVAASGEYQMVCRLPGNAPAADAAAGMAAATRGLPVRRSSMDPGVIEAQRTLRGQRPIVR